MRIIDLRNALDNTADNFTCKLFQLILKADPINIEKLREIFPIEVKMVEHWRESGEIKELDENES